MKVQVQTQIQEQTQFNSFAAMKKVIFQIGLDKNNNVC